VDEQDTEQDNPQNTDTIAATITTASPIQQNKIAAKWARKVANQQIGIMDMGATSGAAAEHDTKAMEDTGKPLAKVFMLPDKSKI
jgi:hypothetical protein